MKETDTKAQEQENNIAITCIKKDLIFILDSFEKWVKEDNVGAKILCSEKEGKIAGISSTLYYFGYEIESQIVSDILCKLIKKDIPAARELINSLTG